MNRKQSYYIELTIRKWLETNRYPKFTLYRVARSVFHIEPHELNPHLAGEIHHTLIKLGYKRISKRKYALSSVCSRQTEGN